MTPIAAVLFDKDGTLFDFAASWGAWAHDFLGAVARDAQEASRLGQAIGYDWQARVFHADSPVIAGTADEIAQALSEALPDLGREAVVDLINAAAAKAQMVPAVDLIALLGQLKARGLRIGLATNDAEAAARAHLAAHELSGFFDFIAGYDSGYGAKPDAGMCLAFAQAMDLAPDQVVMVGDSLHDLHAGRAAGMPCIGVLSGLAVAQDLAPYADAVLCDIGGLVQWLDARGA